MHFEVGSTIYFLYYSQVASVIGVKPIDILSQTSAAVAGLVTTLPHEETHPFNFYMDNFLSNVNLFKELRELKIGACGTAITATAMVDEGAHPNCILCRHKATVLGDKTCDIKTPTTTTWIYGFCEVPLLLTKTCNCYKEYHGF
ncbi:hypothetical protein BGZ97_011557 [Linnemannia gamsii]|uniref:PiggyBac transposable element-derived protein domain-containing protein n=1 Tax=Linnemannia gamsii TaxID=64522 RepID=A0A9P6UMX6_9FUNG|nr:hypothetical protein BGZ97_011557 [Linnemannia gamsii]